MPCHYPVRAYRIGDKENRSLGVVFDLKKGYNIIQDLMMPCGQCLGCKQTRIRSWALRCMHEARMWEHNYFVTLTYNDEHLPHDNSLDYGEFQAFMKKVRHWFGIFDWKKKKQWPKTKVRFFMCGEYGEIGRPHYHVLLYNAPIPDLKYLKDGKGGNRLYTSELISALWNNKGFVTIGSVQYESAAYVAQYCMNKVGKTDLDYMLTDLETGQQYQRKKEMTRMSLKPGIGAQWYEKYNRDVFPHDRCIVNGVQVAPPKYYSERLKKQNPEAYEEIIIKRHDRSRLRMEDKTEERLLVKEKCLAAKIKFYKDR